MTASQLRQTLQDLAGMALGAPPMSPAIANSLLDDVFQVVADEIDFQESFSEATIEPAEDNIYPLPADFARMIGLRYQGEEVRRVRTEEFPGQNQGAFYAPWGIFREAPYQGRKRIIVSGVGGNLGLLYRRYATPMVELGTNQEIFDVPRELHLPVAYEAAWLYLSRQGSKISKDFSGYHQYFQAEVRRLAQRLNQQWSADSTHRIQAEFPDAYQ